jgi:hypothetical protein
LPFAGFVVDGFDAVLEISPGEGAVSGAPAVKKKRKMTLGHNWRKRRFSDVAR